MNTNFKQSSAYELADLIGLCGDGGYNQDAAYMLRQQADQIAELEKQTKPLSDEEIEDLAGYAGENPTKSDMIAFARAIEERHGIK